MIPSLYSIALVAACVLQLCSAQGQFTEFVVVNGTSEIGCNAVTDTRSLIWQRPLIMGVENVSSDMNQRIYVRSHLPSFSQTLVISSARPFTQPGNGGDFRARYQCQITLASNQILLFIYDIEGAVAPTSITRGSDPIVERNETDPSPLILLCEADVASRPPVVGMWRVYYEDGRTGELVGSELTLQNLRNETGLYQCIVRNLAGSGVEPRNTSLVINYPPAVMLTSPSVDPYGRIAAGSDLNLSCYANARPYVTAVELIFINQSVNASVQQDEYVILRDDSPAANMTVGLMRQVNSLMRYAHTGIFVCRATNLLGYGNSSIQVTVIRPPSAPLNLTLVNNTHTNVTLDWHTPAMDGGSPVTYYQVNCTASTGVMHNFTGAIDFNTTIRNITVEEANMRPNSSINATHRHTFSGLFGGEMYECSMAAINSAGIGDLSNSVAFNTTSDAPCAPIVETAARAQNICVSWTIQCDGGSPITGCFLERDIGGITRNFSADNTLCQADGELKTYCDTADSLVVGLMYTYTVRVENSIGSRQTNGDATNADPPVTGTATVPMAEAEESEGLGTGAIVGIIVAAVVAVVILIVVTIIILKSDRKSMSGDKARVMADPSSEPIGLKFTNINESKQPTTYTSIQTIKPGSAPAAASATSARTDKTNYSDLDALKTKAYNNDHAMGSDTVV